MVVHTKDAEIWGDNLKIEYDEDFDEFDEYEQEDRRKDWEIV